MNDKQKIKNLENRIHRLNEIGMALSTESDVNKLFEMILEEARNITNADGSVDKVQIGVNKPSWNVYEYTYDIHLMEERYNIVKFTGGNVGLMFTR